MKTWLVFLAGGIFALALVVTCGGHSTGPGGTANAAGTVVWEYARLQRGISGGAYVNYTAMPVGVEAPASLASCAGSEDICALNAFGLDKWELAHVEPGSTSQYIFKRPK
jgi:hypothetical protein